MKDNIRKEELLALCEYLIENEEADDDIMQMYEDYSWGCIRELNKYEDTYKKLVRMYCKYYNKGV